MAIETMGAALKQIKRLFSEGVISGLSDVQLLTHFIDHRDPAAFEGLMARHGPMALSVCRSVLRDPNDAEDAFQATFLVMLKKADTIRGRHALGGWLYQVAHRVAIQANIAAARRRASEMEAGRMASTMTPAGTTVADDLLPALHEEIARLPEKHRLAIVLCDLEGTTQSQAALELDWSERTLRRRLAEARERLLIRMARRGLAQSGGMLAALFLRESRAALPAAWGDATVRAALATVEQMVTAGAVSAGAAKLSHEVLQIMLVQKLKLALAAFVGAGLMACGASAALNWRGGEPPKAAPPPGALVSRTAPLSAPKPGLQPDPLDAVSNFPARGQVLDPDDKPIALRQPLRARADGPGVPLGTLTVEARDLVTNAPVSNVSLTLRLADDVKLPATTSADGVARFDYSLPGATTRRYFNLTAYREGLVPLSARWFYEASSPTPPDHLLFLTEKATTIGGRVLDEDGQPLADAVVVVSVTKSYPRSDQRVNIGGESTKTGADGRWSLNNVPAQPDSVEIAAYHYLCLDEHSAYMQVPFKPLSALRDGSATLRLRRGTRVDGTVLAPDGQPVAGAKVFYGEGRGYGNSIPPVKTDDHGRFTFGVKPGTISNLIAQAPGFGPTLEPVKVGTGARRVYLTLSRAHSVRGRVVDPNGKPIAHASVRLFWSGSEGADRSSFDVAIDHSLTTSDDGRFEWRDAPGSAVHVGVYADGFASKEKLALASDIDQDIVLVPPTTVIGTVVDGETGQPVEGFSLTLAAAWKPADPLIWQRGWSFGEQSRRLPGSFETTMSNPAHRYLIRVQADGYLAEDSELFEPDGKAHALTYHLTRGEPIRGTIRNPDGSTARDGFVHVVPAHRDGWIEYLSYPDDVHDGDRARTVHAKIETDGSFLLPPQRENFALLALTDTGSLLVPRRSLHGKDVLRLQPWARVNGTVTIDGKPAANLGLQSYEPEESVPVVGEPRLVRQYYVTTDSEGRFELTRVLPGRLTLAQWVPNGVNRRIWPVVRATLDVESGRSFDLKIGTGGRLVTGRLVLPRTDVWMIRKAEIVPKNARVDRPVAFGVEILEEGRFRALDLKPGDYALRIALHEPPPADSCGWGRLLSEYQHEFTVPAGAPASDPLDLGSLDPITAVGRPLRIGDRAPDFRIKTLEGRDLTLADFRGKCVLLDFWATWCAPCLAEMPNLQRVHDEFSKDSRFVIIGVSVDDRASVVAATVKAMKLSWLQGFAGPDSQAVSDYGATAIPATLLIGADGKILATELRGERTRAAVAEALEP